MRRNPIEVELTQEMVDAVTKIIMLNLDDMAYDEQDCRNIAREAIDALFMASREIRVKGSLYGRIELPVIGGSS